MASVKETRETGSIGLMLNSNVADSNRFMTTAAALHCVFLLLWAIFSMFCVSHHFRPFLRYRRVH